LNLAESGFGAQQVLEGFLFVGKGVLPFLLLQLFGGWAMASAAAFMSFTKPLNSSFSWESSRLCMRPARDFA